MFKMRPSKIVIALPFVLLAAAACKSGGEPAAADAKPSIETKEITYQVGDTTLKGFLAAPNDGKKHPGVIVVHEWWGQNDYPRMRATKLAEMGYVGFALDMYGDGKLAHHPGDAQKFMMEVMSNMDTGVARFQAAVDVLSRDEHTDPTKIAAIGYCFGGAVVLHMARIGTSLDAVASFHGNLSTKMPMAPGAFSGKILVATGAADPFVPKESVDAFEAEMKAANKEYELVSYEGAKHGFTNPEADESGKKFEIPLAYDAQADQDSWAKLEAMLRSVWP